jgi:hypothetical protein
MTHSMVQNSVHFCSGRQLLLSLVQKRILDRSRLESGLRSQWTKKDGER